jgi:hypothetical protein
MDNLKSRELDLIGWYQSYGNRAIGSELLYGINTILVYLFEKQHNAYISQSMTACIRLAPMLGNTGLPTWLPIRWQPGEWQTRMATTQS